MKKFEKMRGMISVRGETKRNPEKAGRPRRWACRDGMVPPGASPMFGSSEMNTDTLERRRAAQQARADALTGQLAIEEAKQATEQHLRLGRLLDDRLADLGEADRAREFRDLEGRASKRDRLKLEQHPLRPVGLPKLADEKEASKPS